MDEFQKYYYIKDAADLSGVSEQLIRKWEDRYQIIQPKRLDNGYRVYTLDDILILKEIREARERKLSVKDAIHAVLQSRSEELEELPIQVEESPYVKELIKRGTIYDEAGLFLLLKEANHKYGLSLFLDNTVSPLLRKIGNLWESGEWDESQETISSLVVRDFLTEITRNFESHPTDPDVLGFCLPGEHHEIPLQIILLQLRIQGWRTTRIGASPKFSSIETLVKSLNPKKVLFSASTLFPFESNELLLEELDAVASRYPDIEFHIGGEGARTMTKIIKPKHIHLSFRLEDLME
ncbi:MerR family transcriptional regulator [Oceanobacillus sp. CAU 1775]